MIDLGSNCNFLNLGILMSEYTFRFALIGLFVRDDEYGCVCPRCLFVNASVRVR